MTCIFCIVARLIGVWLLGGLNLLDHAGNWLLLGDADETMSARTARARRDGARWAAYACAALTAGQRVVTFGRVTRDHCDYALDKSIRPNTAEIFDASKMRFRVTPVSEVNILENQQ